MVKRRTFLKAAGTAGTVGIAGLSGCIGSIGGSQPFGDGTLDFYMSPTEPQQLMRAQYAPVASRLEEATGTSTSLTYAAGYSAVLEAMNSGTGDVAETGPFAAALGVSSDPPKAEIVLQRFAYGSWTYSSVITTTKEKFNSGEITKLTDLEGKSIAFADPLSTSGSLFPLFMLKQAGLAIPDQPGSSKGADFQGNWSGHSAAIEQLKNGQVDAAATGRFITLTENDQGERVYKDFIKELAREKGIPRAPIIVSPELSDDEQSQVVSAFQNAPKSMYHGKDGQKDTDDDLWFSDVRPATVDDYQLVIDVANELGISTSLLDQGGS